MQIIQNNTKTQFIKERYQLRYAAGQYWLLDMQQKGIAYQRPMSMNEVGAMICLQLAADRTHEQIAEELSRKYEVGIEEIREDIRQFVGQLEKYGIEFGENE